MCILNGNTAYLCIILKVYYIHFDVSNCYFLCLSCQSIYNFSYSVLTVFLWYSLDYQNITSKNLGRVTICAYLVIKKWYFVQILGHFLTSSVKLQTQVLCGYVSLNKFAFQLDKVTIVHIKVVSVLVICLYWSSVCTLGSGWIEGKQ